MQYESMSVRAKVEEITGEGLYIAEELNEELADTDIAFVSFLYGDVYLVQLFEEHDEGDWTILSAYHREADRFYDDLDKMARELDGDKKVIDWPGRDERYLVEESDDD